MAQQEPPVIEAPPQSSQPQPGGMSKFMSDVMTAVNSPEEGKSPAATPPPTPPPDKPKAAPDVKPSDDKTKTPDAPADKKPATPPAPAKAPEHKEAPAELRKRVDELGKSEKALRSELETLRKEKEELSKKRYWTEDDQKAFDQNKKDAEDLRRQLAETAYEKSDEFKSKFVEPYQTRLKSAISTTIRYFPVVNADDGTQRAATEADFWKVAGASITERAALASQLFGPNAANIIADIRRLEELKESADEAIATHNKGLEAREKQSREEHQARQKQYSQLRELSRKQLTAEFKDFFGDVDDDPELSEAWKKGQDFVDNIPLQSEKMTLEELAAVQEVVRARASWFTRGHLENKRLKSKVSELEAELSKFRESDPGTEKEKGKVVEKAKDELGGGIEALGRRFDQFNS